MLHQPGTPAGRPVHCRRLTAHRRFSWIAGITTLYLATAFGQFSDTFDDPYIHPWMGDTTAFRITNGILQLDAPSGSTTARLHVAAPFADSMEWTLQVRLDFAPSASNQLRAWLGMTDPDPSVARGYLFEVGATGDQDALRLLYADSGQCTLIAESPPGAVAEDPVILDLRVRAGTDGYWSVDQMTGDSASRWIDAQHDGLPLSFLRYLSIECKFTETRRDKFGFDLITAGPPVPDTVPPRWTELIVLDDHSLRLVFDEALDSASVHDPNRYRLMPDLEAPDVMGSGSSIGLAWPGVFLSDSTYTLHVSGITDLPGNPMVPTVRSFQFVRIDTADAGDLLVTEIMADPTPSVGLPESEYIELYNASERTFRLGDYSLRVGSSVRTLPDILLRPYEFVLVCPVSQQAAFASYGSLAPLSSFPVLPNDGAAILLSGPDGDIIHSVTYDHFTYRDPDKDDGGWSLEMRNPLATCAGAGNWQASLHLQGGTPGSVNSVWKPEPDEAGPVLMEWIVFPPDTLRLTFDEDIDPVLMTDPMRYATDPPLGIELIEVPAGHQVLIHFSDTLVIGREYRLVAFPAFDCLGNPGLLPDPPPLFGRPVLPYPGSLVINELLFDPASGGSRFIEVMNTTDDFLDLRGLAFGRITSTDTQLYALSYPLALTPHAIAAFSPDTADIRNRYRVSFPERLHVAELPSWGESSDQVSLLSRGVVLDSFTYSAEWHHPLIRDPEGVSLERISPESPTTEPGTWHSAAGTAGWATPAAANSHRLPAGDDTIKTYAITDRIFSPDNDGYRDFLSLTFRPADPDVVASVRVHDMEGRLVRTLVDNTLIGSDRPLAWDGRNSSGEAAGRGMYVLFIRLWRPDGRIQVYRETCAVVYP